MAELTLNNIKFSNINVDQSVVSNTVKNVRKQFVTNDQIDITKISNMYNAVDQGLNQWSNMAFTNAVEIDWNGAELELPEELGGTKTINTTGQLFRRL